MLRLVGAAIRGAVKGGDVAACYGGEEFAIILPHTTLEHAVAVADRIRAAIVAKNLIKRSSGGCLGHITMSFGVAALRAGARPKNLIERADACLYASKRNGKNQVTCDEAGADAPRCSVVAWAEGPYERGRSYPSSLAGLSITDSPQPHADV